MRKNTAGQLIGAQMTTIADGSPFTGAVTCYVLGDGGTQAIGTVGSGACVHEGGGLHNYAPSQAETNYDLAQYQFRGTGAITVTQHVFTTAGLIDDLASAVTGQLGQTQPRINREPDPGFTTKVNGRADGLYKCTRPIRLTAGAISGVYVFIDMSPLFGDGNYVETVGTAAASTGSITPGADKGPRDNYAVLELDGTADEDCEVTVPVTMESGTTVPVVFDVEVLGD
jgi:hypothetical protein